MIECIWGRTDDPLSIVALLLSNQHRDRSYLGRQTLTPLRWRARRGRSLQVKAGSKLPPLCSSRDYFPTTSRRPWLLPLEIHGTSSSERPLLPDHILDAIPPCLDHPNFARFQTPACVPQSYLAKQLQCTRTAVKANHAPASQAVANANAQAPAARNPAFPLLYSGLHHAMADSIAPVSGALCAL